MNENSNLWPSLDQSEIDLQVDIFREKYQRYREKNW